MSFNQVGFVTASGVQLNRAGTAVELSPTFYRLSFPGSQPVHMTLTPTTTTPTTIACVTTVQETGTFFYSRDIPELGAVEGGSGPYTLRGVTVAQALSGGGCGAPLFSFTTIEARATEIDVSI